ncbi:alcohol dehydrogenase catalytic domain-containing protein [Microbacterium sp.]|uniref:zinc-dependent alcohol dehydrogenase n=1 Tax=Microbacterium sp. TaxID=51671 RepID=UPI003340FCFB
MHALAYTKPWEMSIVDRADPAPGPGEVVIDVIATGICGSDSHGYSGENGRRRGGQVMGHEAVGRVRDGALVTFNPLVSCGECGFCLAGQTQACPDARVIGVDPLLDGSFAERVLVPARNVVPLPADMPVLHGALIEPLAVGYHAVMQGAPEADDILLVIGGGPIGQAAALGARRAGLSRILVSEPTAPRRALLEQLGFSTTTPEDAGDELRERFGGKATLVVDAVGLSATVTDALTHSVTRARIVLVGMGAPEITIPPYGITVGERRMTGSYCYSEEHFRSTAEWVGAGRPELDALIDRTVPLSDGPQAFHDVARGTGGSNKTLVVSSSALLAGATW